MTQRCGFLTLIAATLACALAAGCSGSSSSGVTPPAATPSGAPVPVANAARGSLTLALDALKTARYYAQFIRPGAETTLASYRLIAARKDRALGPLDRGAVPTPNPAPSCDPQSQTAVGSTPDVSGRNYVVVTAFYPSGDALCSQSPVAVTEMYYPNVPAPFSSGPQLGLGYEASFIKSGIVEFDTIETAIYAAGAGSGNVATEIDRYDQSQAPALVPPPAGKFPETFPLAFPLPNPPPVGEGQSFVSDFYATVESSPSTSTTGTASLVTTNPNFLPFNTLGPSQNLAAVDTLDVSVTGSGGQFSYSARHRNAMYAFDVAPIALTNNGALLGKGQTLWVLSPLVSGFHAYNFGTGPTDAATYLANGSVPTEAATFKDLVNAVTVQLNVGSGGSSFTATDDLRKKPATHPSVIPLGASGTSRRYIYALDGSYGYVLVDSVAE